MKPSKLTIISCLIVALFSLQLLPVVAQDDGMMPVSGFFNYTYEELGNLITDTTYSGDFVENEVWEGDISGTAVAPFPFVLRPDGTESAWLLAEFEGTVLGEYEGTLVIMSVYTRPVGETDWHGQWMILSGTGDLENMRGYGTGWGPGSSNEDDGITDIFYSGIVYFVEPISS